MFKRIQNFILALGVIAVLLAVIQTQLFGVDPEVAASIPGFNPWYTVLRWGIIIAPILIAALIAVTNRFKSGNKWLMLRSGAESLKREMYRYRAKAGIYGDEGSTDTTPEQKLGDKLARIRRQVMKTAVSEGALKPHGQTMPSDMGFLSSSAYLDRRLDEQHKWYESRTASLENKMRLLHWSTILIGGLGTLLAAIGFELWVAVTAALAAAFATYLEYTRTEETLVQYNQVATDLKNIVTWWSTLGSEEQKLASNHNLLVQQTEQALEAEHSGWVQNMTEALVELQEQQAAMKDRVKADVQAVYDQGAEQQAEFELRIAEARATAVDAAEAEAEAEGDKVAFVGPIPGLESLVSSVSETAVEAPPAEAEPAEAAAETAAEAVAEPEAKPALAPTAFNVTEQQMREILKGTKEIDAWYKVAQKLLPKYDINTPLRIAGFFAQCMHESLNFSVLEENLFYRASTLNKVFPKYFKNAGRDANEYAKKPEKIANVVYASRMGNGNTASGDGYRFRGRGVIQLTGRNNYTKFGKTINKTAEEVIDYVQTKEGALASACWYWNSRNINAAADAADVVRMTKLVNGGTHGLAERQEHFKHACAVLGLDKDEIAALVEAASRILRKGAKGPKVVALQKALNIGADGDFGPGTEKALKKWQEENGLTPDGIAGPDTLKLLLKQ